MNKSYFVHDGIQYHIGSNSKYYKRHLCWDSRPGWENFFVEVSYVTYMRMYRRACRAYRSLVFN